MHPANKKSRNNTDEKALIKVYRIFCDTALIFSEKNNYVIHDQISSEFVMKDITLLKEQRRIIYSLHHFAWRWNFQHI